MQKCIECGNNVPPYLNYLCEYCWAEYLNEKLEREDNKNGKNSG